MVEEHAMERLGWGVGASRRGAPPPGGDEERDALLPDDAAGEEQKRSAMIMIIDDEPLNIKVAGKYLKMAGYERISSTSDSTTAMEAIARVDPDVILLDIMMPEIDGLQILSRIRADYRWRYLPVLILTAARDQEIKQKALLLGATDFLPKPIDPNDLLPRIANALTIKSYQDQTLAHADALELRVKERTAELVASRLEMIHCLGRAAEYRDNETGRHVIRVGRYVGIIARALGMEERKVEMLEHAAPLHDVGKIGIPDAILLKPGRLTPEEMEIMQKHCQLGKRVFEAISGAEKALYLTHADLGARIIGDTGSPLLRMVSSIALTHHEKWDGSGYPLALAGEEIPIEGRITAVADVFDALSSKRPYKPAFPREKCFAIMRSERGKHFDPRVLDAFFSHSEEIVQTQIEYADLE
jgi:putative two-component system response regulator